MNTIRLLLTLLLFLAVPSWSQESSAANVRELIQEARDCLCPGKKGKRDRNKALECLKKAAELGSAEAESMLGRLELDFCYTTYDREKGLLRLQAARSKRCFGNDFLTTLELTAPEPFRSDGTDIYFSSPSSRYFSLEDIIILKANPGRKSAAACYGDQLSMLYDYAEIRGMSQAELKKSADRGDVCAGILWAYRVTQKLKDDAETQSAAAYLQQAAERGYEWAALVLASHYRISANRKAGNVQQWLQETDDCFALLSLAAEQHLNEAAALAVGLAVQESMAGKQRELSAELLQEGLSYMEKRARYKLDATVYLLGQMYLWGIFVPQDENKGVEWLEMLALSGDSEACRLLCYYFAGNAPVGKTPRSQPDPAKIRYYASLDRRRALRDGMLSPKLMLY